jgi:hypothetical protein
MAKEFIAYIDEAGDEGFGKLAAGPIGGQSRWLMLGACVASRENDLSFPTWRDAILARFPRKRSRDLHFRELAHPQKIVACQEIAKLPVRACVVMSHKVTIPGSKWESVFKKKGYLYNYLIRWLLERVTTHCATAAGKSPCTLKVIFSRRSGTNYLTMMDYLKLMRDGGEVMTPTRSINWNVLDVENIAVENHKKWAGLQIADCITSAFFSAFEANLYGNYETGYADLLRSKLIRDEKGHTLNCGLTGVPNLFKMKMDAPQEAFVRTFIKK